MHQQALAGAGLSVGQPEGSRDLTIDGNAYRGRPSTAAAGINVCLLAVSHLSFEYATDIFCRHYHWLLEYAKDHVEAGAIFAAID